MAAISSRAAWSRRCERLRSTRRLRTHHPSDQSQLVEAFLLRCNKESGVSLTVTRKHIWRAVGHKSGRQFYYWQKSDQMRLLLRSAMKSAGSIVRLSPRFSLTFFRFFLTLLTCFSLGEE